MAHSKVDRRHGPDRLQRSFFWLTLLCWGLFLSSMLAFHYARPEIEYGLLRYWNIDIRTTWDAQSLPIFLYALWSCCGVTLISLVLNYPRNRRLEDHNRFYFIILLLIATGSLLAYYLQTS